MLITPRDHHSYQRRRQIYYLTITLLGQNLLSYSFPEKLIKLLIKSE